MDLDSDQLLPSNEKGGQNRATGLTGLASFVNIGSAVFNMMNAVIGAGIISLGYTASILGSAQFVIWLLLVVAISTFTMDLVCSLSKYAGCYKDIQTRENNDNGNITADVCDLSHKCKHGRIFSYEAIGSLLFGGWIKFFINFIILFYLVIAITTYFIIIKDNLPGIALGLLELSGIEHNTDSWYLDSRFLLGMMILCVQLPLAFCRRIDFLGFTSFIGMACMGSFVVLVVLKQPAAATLCGHINYTISTPKPTCETVYFTFSINSVYAIPMMLFSFMCHGNILSIVAELKPTPACNNKKYPSQARMRRMICGAVFPTTVLYIITALFAYASYFNRTESFLLRMYGLWLQGDIMLFMSKILVTLCITFSVPILNYPCRYSLWNLIHELVPSLVPRAYDNGHPETWNRFWYYTFAIIIQGSIFVLVCITDDFKLVLSLGGAIAGSCIIQIFPAMFYLKIQKWAYRSFYDKLVWLIMVLGVVTFFANTAIILQQATDSVEDGHQNDFYDEQNKIALDFIGKSLNGSIPE